MASNRSPCHPAFRCLCSFRSTNRHRLLATARVPSSRSAADPVQGETDSSPHSPRESPRPCLAFISSSFELDGAASPHLTRTSPPPKWQSRDAPLDSPYVVIIAKFRSRGGVLGIRRHPAVSIDSIPLPSRWFLLGPSETPENTPRIIVLYFAALLALCILQVPSDAF